MSAKDVGRGSEQGTALSDTVHLSFQTVSASSEAQMLFWELVGCLFTYQSIARSILI